jgi:hypothetical protein
MAIAILAATALWHALATWHFTFFPARTLARSTTERPVSEVAVELFRFLGAINSGFSVLALCAIARPEARPVAFLVLALANLSQLVIDARVSRLALAKGPMFKQIFAGDALFTAANLAGLAAAS